MRIEFRVPVVVRAKPKRTKDVKLVIATVNRVFDVPEYSTADAPVVLSGWFPGDDDDDGNPSPVRWISAPTDAAESSLTA
ncbi:hypothetical protein GOB57_24195 [Sinorhizobium meliloti]|nr:hypothetical protein [Sinorhizobium meliloti]